MSGWASASPLDFRSRVSLLTSFSAPPISGIMPGGEPKGGNMSDQPPPAMAAPPGRVVPRIMQAIGLLLVLSSTWRGVRLLGESVRYLDSFSFWLEVSLSVPLGLLCWLGGLALVRSKEVGCHAVYAAALVSFTSGWTAQHFFTPRSLLLPGFVWPFPLWYVNVAVLAALVACQVMLRKPDERWCRWPGRQTLLIWLSAPAAAVTVLVSSHLRLPVEEEAGKKLEQGMTAFDEGEPDEANRRWEEVVARYPYTLAWGPAVFNSGLAHHKKGRHREAIALFERLLNSSVNDLEPGGRLMEAYQNYRHQACLQLSRCHEDLGDFPSALRYALLARDRYPYRSWCGTCQMSANTALKAQIERLERGEREPAKDGGQAE
jgi:Tetratricopeptide repeat